MTARQLERALQLTPGALESLTNRERAVVNVLVPAGRFVSTERLLRARVDAAMGPPFTEAALSIVVSQAREKLDAASQGRLGVAHIQGRGRYLWDAGADDWIETGPLRFSRTGLRAEINGRRSTLTVSLAFLLEPLVRAHAERPEAYVPMRELQVAYGEVAPIPPGLAAGFDLERDLDARPAWHKNRVREAVMVLQRLIGVSIESDDEGGHRLVLAQAGGVDKLTVAEQLVLDALRPAGQVVHYARVAQVRVDAGVGVAFAARSLTRVVGKVSRRLEAGTRGRLGIAEVRDLGYFLWDEDADDWREAAGLRFSRTALVAEVAGRRTRLAVPLAFVLDVLVRAYVDHGAEGFAPMRELLLALGAVAPPPPGLDVDFDLEADLEIDPEWHRQRLVETVAALERAVGIDVVAAGDLGYRLVLDA